ncbi:cation diffusion facilitator family transporter [secondary endosymbiont of Ctenarytaina eucalypti]|uniref:Cation diffusion facilitator family transporter n=1 Tax=secondary endosymbiont of Ctenarytaina eucalypti TaxID=1199245 RepID=J3TEX6_9ENTR|nr:cation diffusion facilitator family transporter [secondary endosymbiont of Ctenarytaina eucalypti]AFP84482.1 cation diffusion facilitator family transporter [secondary endosymbiont of Ctenarytaina eucalypti]
MITWIKHYAFAKVPKKNLTRLASLISLGIALTLVCLKIWAWRETGSIALLASSADGLVDVFAALVTLTGVCYAQRPADRGHRFGHGKAEAIAAFVQAMLLVAAGVALGIESGGRLITPQGLPIKKLGIMVIVVSTLCASFLVTMQTLVVKHTKSTAIAADRMHYITDVAVNIAVLFALMLEYQVGWVRADASVALAISFYMVWYACSMIGSTLFQLLDRELDSADRKRITSAVLSCPGVEAVHDLRTRNGGDRIFVELHVEVHGQLTVDRGHAICNHAEIVVKTLFTAAEVSAHLEPAGITDDRLDDLIK